MAVLDSFCVTKAAKAAVRDRCLSRAAALAGFEAKGKGKGQGQGQDIHGSLIAQPLKDTF